MASSPTVGRTVLYRLSEQDSRDINRRRRDFEHRTPVLDGTGFVGRVGNSAAEGQVCAATVVRVWNESTDAVNLQVHLDGNDILWATSRSQGDDPGQWAWPEVS
ncbi:hypothetical protein [Streptomyces malaysiensis]|uniref:Uncharacterized protein n=1 Tax=Streptomyces malaysiensis TaxID=92644 RepID=A0A7X5X7E3_STRMQ|nr:hypothetical protein [Streptomyces malaysiensis]NIY68009.1 hypothetical protein [Streptomyces malaysiensis]